MLPPLPRRIAFLNRTSTLPSNKNRAVEPPSNHRARLVVELGDRHSDDAVEHVGGVGALVDVARAAPGEEVLEGLVQDLADSLAIGLEDLADFLFDRQRHVGTGLQDELEEPYQKNANPEELISLLLRKSDKLL